MKISFELEQGYIDIWNEEIEEWDRYIKVNKKSVVGEKKIPEKLDMEPSYINYNLSDIVTSVNEKYEEITNKINEIIDYLHSKGE